MNLMTERDEAADPANSSAAPILLCAATRWEAGPLVRRWGLKRSSVDSYEGLAGGRPVIVLKTGIGRENAARALAGRPGSERIRRVLSVGFAGALQPRMNSGDLALDVHGLDSELVEAARELAGAQGVQIHFGRIAHSDKVLSRPEEKAALGSAERASAVDMESAAIRDWCARRDLPFLAARVVLDGIQDKLPSGTPAGENFGALVSYALGNAAELPLMISVGLRQRKAMAVLARFVQAYLEKL